MQKKRFNTYACCISMMAAAMSITALSLFISEAGKRFNLSTSQSGLLFTINFLGFATFTLLGTVLCKKFGKKIVLTAACVGLSVSCLALSVVGDFLIVIVLMFIYGGCGGIIETFVSSFISDLNPEKSAYYINLSQVFFGIGAIIAPLGIGLLLENGVPYSTCYIIMGIIAAFCGVLMSQVKSKKMEEKESTAISDLKSLAKNKMFLVLCVCMVFYAGAEIGTWGWMGTFLEQNFSFTPLYASFAMTSFWVAMTVGRYLCGFLSKRIPLARLIVILAWLSVVFAVALSFSNQNLFFVMAFLLGLACSSLFPFMMAYGEDYVGEAKGTAFALFMVSANVGSMIIPYLIGVVSEKSEFSTAMLVPAMFLAVVALIFTGIATKMKKVKS